MSPQELASELIPGIVLFESSRERYPGQEPLVSLSEEVMNKLIDNFIYDRDMDLTSVVWAENQLRWLREKPAIRESLRPALIEWIDTQLARITPESRRRASTQARALEAYFRGICQIS